MMIVNPPWKETWMSPTLIIFYLDIVSKGRIVLLSNI